MPALTQGTHIFFKDPDASGGPAIVRVRKVTNFNPGGNPADQLEITDLEETNSKEYMRGLRTPGQASLTINSTPGEPSHQRLNELAEGDEESELEWFLGWSDGTAEPSVDAEGAVTLPTARTWYRFNAYVSDFPFDFQGNSIVKTQASLQRSGRGHWVKKEAV
ncbi:phage tail tube protein [Vreelandella aquamarina]